MADLATYIEAMQAAKDQVLAAKNAIKSAKVLIAQVQEESGIEMPYNWYLDECENATSSFVKEIEVDIQAFEAEMNAEGAESASEPGEEKPAGPVKTLGELVAKM